MNQHCQKAGIALIVSILALLAGDAARLQAGQESRPNILFIMSDDHAAHAIGAYGGRLADLNPTPTLDRLAAEGVRFRNAFCSNSICVPSRATLLTGQYSHHNGVRTLEGGVPAERQTLAHIMRNAGYQTAIIGKWHLKEEPAAFDYYSVLEGQGKYFNPEFRVRGHKPWPQNQIQPSDQAYDSLHSSDVIADLSIKWLKTRKDKKPFFLMHHFKAPHDNFENAERYDWLYNDVDIPEPDNLRRRMGTGPIDRPRYGTSVSRRNKRRNMGHHMTTPEHLTDEQYQAETYQRYLKKYLRCVRGVDDNIARLLDVLADLGELENTIVIYTSDQGFMLGEHDYIDKRWMYDESMRIPLIVWSPKRIEGGQVKDELITNIDLMPSIIDLAGGEYQEQALSGSSIVPLLHGKEAAEWRDELYYRYWMHMAHHDVPGHCGIRTIDHKLIYFYAQPLDAEGARDVSTPPHWELYDLKADPNENHNLINDPRYRKVAKQLQQRLYELRHTVGDTDQLRETPLSHWDEG